MPVMPEKEGPRAPGSFSKDTLPEKQAAMKKKRGNPYLQKGVYPYCVNKNSLADWLEDHPLYERKTNYKSAEVVRLWLHERVNERRKVGLDSKGLQRFLRILNAMYRTAMDPRSKNQVAAAKLLLERGFGVAKLAEEDAEAIRKGGLTLVYVNRPEIDESIPMAKPELPAAEPEFVEGEVVDE
jgi:hypothetical protein